MSSEESGMIRVFACVGVCHVRCVERAHACVLRVLCVVCVACMCTVWGLCVRVCALCVCVVCACVFVCSYLFARASAWEPFSIHRPLPPAHVVVGSSSSSSSLAL